MTTELLDLALNMGADVDIRQTVIKRLGRPDFEVYREPGFEVSVRQGSASGTGFGASVDAALRDALAAALQQAEEQSRSVRLFIEAARGALSNA